MDNQRRQMQLAQFIEEGEKDKAVQSLVSWAYELGYKNVIIEILEPFLIEWGKLWMQGKLSLAHGYLAGKVAEELFINASKTKDFSSGDTNNKGTIVLGNIEDDFHPLGRRLVNIFATAAGWKIQDLGNDVVAETFIEHALENQAQIIAVSAMMFSTARNIQKVRNELEKRSLSGKIQLAVGGAVFKLRPELVFEIGADGTADSAIEAPILFDKLLDKSKKHYE